MNNFRSLNSIELNSAEFIVIAKMCTIVHSFSPRIVLNKEALVVFPTSVET